MVEACVDHVLACAKRAYARAEHVRWVEDVAKELRWR